MRTQTVLVAGATGYLGRHIVKQYMSMGWDVRALVRNAEAARMSGLETTELFEGEATKPLTLCGAMEGVDLGISTLGITRQRDGLTYWDVDYQANANLLVDALTAGVDHFAYVHALNAHKMQNIPLVAAKQAFANLLQASPIKSTVIAPSGFFSDMVGKTYGKKRIADHFSELVSAQPTKPDSEGTSPRPATRGSQVRTRGLRA